jgi:hypothetical protein
LSLVWNFHVSLFQRLCSHCLTTVCTILKIFLISRVSMPKDTGWPKGQQSGSVYWSFKIAKEKNEIKFPIKSWQQGVQISILILSITDILLLYNILILLHIHSITRNWRGGSWCVLFSCLYGHFSSWRLSPRCLWHHRINVRLPGPFFMQCDMFYHDIWSHLSGLLNNKAFLSVFLCIRPVVASVSLF